MIIGVASPGVVDEASGEVPELLFVPAHPVEGQPNASFALEPRMMDDGLAAVIAFTSVQQLVAQLGRYQPWAAFEPEDLRRLVHAIGIDRVYVDPKV